MVIQKLDSKGVRKLREISVEVQCVHVLDIELLRQPKSNFYPGSLTDECKMQPREMPLHLDLYYFYFLRLSSEVFFTASF